MNRKSLLIIGAFVLLVSGALSVLFFANSDDMKSAIIAPQPTASQTPTTNPPANQPSVAAGSYQAYDAATVAQTSGTKVLFFHAPWCPQCRSIEKDINPSTIPNGVSIFKVDYDSATDLKKKYGVTLQTTFVVINDQGEIVKKHVAYSEPTFAAVKKAIL